MVIKRKLWTLLVIGFAFFCLGASNPDDSNFVNLDSVLSAEKYYLIYKTEDNIMYKKDAKGEQPEVYIKFDLKNQTARKNEFVFDVINAIKIKDNRVLVSREALKKILNVNIHVKGNSISTTPLVINQHSWTKICEGLVAHAGGCINKENNPPNCREALVYSYNNGHRVFEIDFNLTTDGKLAAVHDWVGYSGAKSSTEWKKVKIWDVFTSMMLEDVLDIMLVNKDMYVITDTKSFEYTEKQIKEQIEILVETAKKKDPTLAVLNRIIPQIYNQPMYDIVMNKHKFKSVIYTLYASPDSDGEVVKFVAEHSNIKVVTMFPQRGTAAFVKSLGEKGKLVYFHTINDLQEIKQYKKSGIVGIYTDFIFPRDITR